MVVPDSNALMRFFLKDDIEKASEVEKLLDSDEEILLLECVVIELVYLLLKTYRRTKGEALSALRFLQQRKNVLVDDEVALGIEIFSGRNLSFVDCLILAHSSGYNRLAENSGLRAQR